MLALGLGEVLLDLCESYCICHSNLFISHLGVLINFPVRFKLLSSFIRSLILLVILDLVHLLLVAVMDHLYVLLL